MPVSIMELNDGAVVTPGVTVKLVRQYVVAPNEIGLPAPIEHPADAWVIGVQLAFDGDLLHPQSSADTERTRQWMSVSSFPPPTPVG